MIQYRYIQIEEYDDPASGTEEEKKIILILENLLKECDFIDTRYGIMYSKESIKGIGDSLRGPTYEFTKGYTYHYNIRGGWKKEEE